MCATAEKYNCFCFFILLFFGIGDFIFFFKSSQSIYISLYDCQTITILFLTCFNNSNQGEKGQIFQSCTSVREDPQFLVQLGSKEPTQPDTCAQLQLQTLLSPGTEIPSKQAKQLKVIFTSKYVQKKSLKLDQILSYILKLTLMCLVQVKFDFRLIFI